MLKIRWLLEGGKRSRMNEMVKKMLKDSEKEYERIINASNALKKGEISGDDFNQINDEALSNVDNIISEYKHK